LIWGPARSKTRKGGERSYTQKQKKGFWRALWGADLFLKGAKSEKETSPIVTCCVLRGHYIRGKKRKRNGT